MKVYEGNDKGILKNVGEVLIAGSCGNPGSFTDELSTFRNQFRSTTESRTTDKEEVALIVLTSNLIKKRAVESIYTFPCRKIRDIGIPVR